MSPVAEGDAPVRRRDDPLALAWHALVRERLPAAAADRPDWPVRLDHCFARILLDAACGGPWRARTRAPAWAHLTEARLRLAIATGEAVLAGTADLAALNARSLAWRGKRGPSAPRRTPEAAR